MLEPFFRTGVIIVVVIVLTRIQGLRSFSKMSIFDFAMTIATGSLVATAIVDKSLDLSIAIAAIVAIFLFQGIVAWLRVHVHGFRGAVDNTPLLLMAGQKIYTENLATARVTEADLFAKMREANVWNTEQVIAVVLETTGDVSVLRDLNPVPLSRSDVLKGIRGIEDTP
ncbi:hypothetical protein P775_16555 [Puniceibacterium antarcticum]|uniref:YetF C-terminal domain-containing protein n=1 Tax=Puniceibacterium antarcticum TaxID=1206336 RepID=A0A2G8RC34_9RHOB|nr:YetF domain-containing protein [Puniceibacterium antarcticum]PIL19053.1 hypothetical protein P775_16555 [Puniceibacterium antarcticum]